MSSRQRPPSRTLFWTGLALALVALLSFSATAPTETATWSAQAPLTGPLTVPRSLRRTLVLRTGSFEVRWDGMAGALTVLDAQDPGHPVFATLPHTAFVGASVGQMTALEHLGYFSLDRTTSLSYTRQTVASIALSHGAVLVHGRLVGSLGRSVPYVFELQAAEPAALSYRAHVGRPADRVYLSWRSEPREGYFGFGVQFSLLDMQGEAVPMLPEEHGYGRGREPLTLLADVVDGGAGGNYYNTYAPVPFFLTSDMQALYSENRGYQAFNFRDPNLGQLEVDAPAAHGLLFAGASPAGLLRAYGAAAGHMQPLPGWTQRGLVLAAEGGTQAVLSHLKTLLAHGVAVKGLWIQDWTGLHRTSFGEQVVWNWQLDRSHYPHWQELLDFLHRHGIKLLGYINPFLTDTGKPMGPQNLYLVAKAKGYLVDNGSGVPYAFHYPGNTAYLVDLGNPKAARWLEGIMRRQLVGNGFDGWMADFGEELPIGASTSHGIATAADHNLYPVLWAKVNQAVLKSAHLEGKAFVFLRSAFAGSQPYLPSIWLGDQLESWGADNGLESSVTALLSAGLSGFPTAYGDLGGYTSFDQFPLHYVRTPELLRRWMEVDAFTSLMRSHEGNLPAKNAQVWSSPAIMRELRRMTDLYAALAPYREQLMQAAARSDAPLDRPVFFDYPRDAEAYRLGSREFMLGPDVLVAPVYQANVHSVKVYVPAGDWREIWTNRTYHVARGTFVQVPAPLGQPAVFARGGSQADRELARAVRRLVP